MLLLKALSNALQFFSLIDIRRVVSCSIAIARAFAKRSSTWKAVFVEVFPDNFFPSNVGQLLPLVLFLARPPASGESLNHGPSTVTGPEFKTP